MINYLYYKLESRDLSQEIEKRKEVKLKKLIPSLCSFHNILWFILSFGKFKEYQLINENDEIVSRAQVMPYIYKFKFMDDKRGVHIGPCSTHKNYRGQGYYPFLLNLIMNDCKKTDTFYIFCSENNISSIRGIEKAKFKLYAKGIKNKWGMYIKTNTFLYE